MVELGEKTIRNRRFTLNTVKQFIDAIGKKFTMQYSFLSEFKDKLSLLATKTFRVKLDSNKVRVTNQNNYQKALSSLSTGIDRVRQAIEKQELKVEEKNVDFSELSEKIDGLNRSITAIQIPEPKEVKFDQVVRSLSAVQKQIASIPKPDKIVLPKHEKVVLPSSYSFVEAKDIIKQLVNLQDTIKALPKNMPKSNVSDIDLSELLDGFNRLEKAISNIKLPEVEFPDTIDVGNFPPQKTPQPVTNININGLRGPILSTQLEVGASAALLPNTALANRRSIILYNGGNNILYIGNSSVTSSNGFPIAAGQYSPSIDLSDKVDLYGISGGGTLDIRVFESSMDEIGS